ncbi:MAG: autotransporter-associated beta strand repeat-containing protein, partial [Verrucomicrobiota bacterium]
MKSSRNNSHIHIRFAALTLALILGLGARVLEAGTTNTIGSTTLNSGSTLTIASGNGTICTGTLQFAAGTSAAYVAVNGPGTLILGATGNSATIPDIHFNYDDVHNSTANWGCSVNAPVNIGTVQRFIHGKTNHASVDQYGVSNTECMFNGIISGSGGLTFIAQDSFTGSNPMEVPFALNAANTFTGPVEIQRGSVYLGVANAFPSGNVLRFNVAAGNFGKFFLYGRNATISDLSSTGGGNALIANGNRNPSSIAAATLTITQNNPGTYAGTIINTNVEYAKTGGATATILNLIKQGSAALTLTGTNSFTGTMAVNAGKLYMNTKSTGGGAVTVANGATLGGSGAISATITVANGGALEAGDGTGIGTLTLKGLTLGSASTDTSTIYVTRNSTPGIIAVTNNNGLTVNSGASKVTINVGGTAPAVGQYPLITYAGTLGGTGFSAFKLGTLPPRVTAALVNNTANHSIDLNVTAVDFPRWSGALSTEWSVNTLAAPKNWVLNSDGSTQLDFQGGDTVMFTDAAAGTTVDVSVADVIPGGVTFNNTTQNFSLTGVKAIAGTAGLTKTGTGTLTILNNNTYGGATTISGGTVQVGNGGTAGSLGTGAVTDNGALVLNRSDAVSVSGLSGSGNLQQNGSGTLSLLGSDSHTGGTLISAGILQVGNGGAVTAFGNGPITNNSALVFNSSSTISVAGVICGTGSVTNASAGTVNLNATNMYSGGTTIRGGGTVNLGTAFALGSGDVTISSGALNFPFPSGSSNVVANNISLPLIGTQEFIIQGPSSPTTVRLTGVLSGGAAGQSYRLVDSNVGLNHNDILILDNPNNSFQGIINMWRGTLGITSDGALGDANNAIFIDVGNGNGGLRFDANNLVLGSVRTITLNGTEVINPQGYTATLSGPLVISGQLVKTNSGTLILAGSTTGAGVVNVTDGTLQIGNGGTTGTLGGGSVMLAKSSSVLVFNRSDALTVANAIGGPGSVVQNGPGSVTLTGAITNTGSITVNAGSLVVNGTLTASSGVTVVSNATLSGSGTIASPINLSGAIAPGAGGVGSFSTGPQAWNGGGSYVWELTNKNSTPGVGWDLLNVTGGINLQAAATNPFTIKILPVGPVDFSHDTTGTFTLAALSGTVTNFDTNAFIVDASALASGLGAGRFFLSTNAGALVLNFTAVQPPAITSLGISSTNVLVNGMVRIVVQAT